MNLNRPFPWGKAPQAHFFAHCPKKILLYDELGEQSRQSYMSSKATVGTLFSLPSASLSEKESKTSLHYAFTQKPILMYWWWHETPGQLKSAQMPFKLDIVPLLLICLPPQTWRGEKSDKEQLPQPTQHLLSHQTKSKLSQDSGGQVWTQILSFSPL